jgi:hypothetical protein
MINVGELSALGDFLEAHPQFHDQSNFYCGTTACAAGWTVARQVGFHPGMNFDGSAATTAIYEQKLALASDLGVSGAFVSTAMLAQIILGLSSSEREALFYGTLRYEDLAEQEAIALIRALVAREKEELTEEQREVLFRYGLSELPSWKREVA